MQISRELGPEPSLALSECDVLIDAFGREAHKHQVLAWATGLTVVVSSASIPVLILISTEIGAFVFGKIVPAMLAAIAAIAGGAAQIVRPHDRWRMHRRWQRWLQAERIRYVHGLDEYGSDDRERVLLSRVVTASRGIMEEWEAMMPPNTDEALATLPKATPPGP